MSASLLFIAGPDLGGGGGACPGGTPEEAAAAARAVLGTHAAYY